MPALIELFKGLMEGKIPFGSGGYIINIRFSDDSDYTIFETIGFKNVKNIHQDQDSVTFQSDGYKIYFLFEPRSFTRKHMEPYLREDGNSIPLRWDELHNIETPKKDHIYISKKPYISFGSFNIEVPAQGRFVYYLYDNDNIDANACKFMSKILGKDFQLPSHTLEQILTPYKENLEYFHKAIAED